MNKERAPRNRTIDLSEEELNIYNHACVPPDELVNLLNFENKVIRGDLFHTVHFLPDAFVDLLIVDPPYNLSKKFAETAFKKMSQEQYEEFTEKWISSVKHTLKETATIYVCCDWKISMIIGKVLENHFHIQNRITWQREKGRGAKSNWKNGMEDIWFATVSPKDYVFHVDAVKIRRKVLAPYKENGKPKDWVESEAGKFRDTFPSNFWDDISIPYWSMPENTDHPTQKPEKLLAKLILASSTAGDLVFDPFLGSGTTAVVAKKLGRNYLGVECEEFYCGLAQKRLEMAEENRDIQGYTDGVFWERNSNTLQQKSKIQKNQD